jgi:hypothetical protein
MTRKELLKAGAVGIFNCRIPSEKDWVAIALFENGKETKRVEYSVSETTKLGFFDIPGVQYIY